MMTTTTLAVVLPPLLPPIPLPSLQAVEWREKGVGLAVAMTDGPCDQAATSSHQLSRSPHDLTRTLVETPSWLTLVIAMATVFVPLSDGPTTLKVAAQLHFLLLCTN